MFPKEPQNGVDEATLNEIGADLAFGGMQPEGGFHGVEEILAIRDSLNAVFKEPERLPKTPEEEDAEYEDWRYRRRYAQRQPSR